MTAALVTRTESAGAATALVRKKRAKSLTLAALLCGIFAFFLALANNVFLSDPASRQIFDSCHYIQTSHELYLWIKDLLFGTNLSVGKETLASMLLIDGPVLPFCGALSCALFGTAPSIQTSQFLMVFQAAVHGLTASLVVALAHKWLRSRLYLPVFAGIVWSLYPGALAGSGMFLTETITTLLVVSLVWLSVSFGRSASFGHPAASGLAVAFSRTQAIPVAAGFAFACIMLLKPPLIPLAIGLIALPMATIGKIRVVPSLLAFAVGLALVVTPWVAFTQYATGKAQVLPQRVPSVNLAVGNDVEFDGWHTLPLPPLTMLEILLPPPQIISSLGRTHGSELIPLTLRKVTRLWWQPWIPSQRDVLGISYALQCSIHQLLMALALPALLFVLSTTRVSRRMSSRRLLSTCLCLVLFVHFLYLPFETVARYALPAIPAVILITVCATAEMLRRRRRALLLATTTGITACLALFILWQTDLFPYLSGAGASAVQIASIGPAIALAIVALTLGTSWLHASSINRTLTQKIRIACASALLWLVALGVAFAAIEPGSPLPEWKTALAPASYAIRTITSAPSVDWNNVKGAYVLVDTNSAIKNAQITVNGQRVETPRRALEVCDFEYKHTVEEFLQICAGCRNLRPEDMRSWWLAPVNIETVANLKGAIELKVSNTATPETPVVVYGQYLRDGQKELLIPHLHYFGFSKLEASKDRIESRHTDRFHRRVTTAASRFESTPAIGSTSAPGQSTPQVDRDSLSVASCDLSIESGIQTGEYRIYLLIAYKTPAESVSNRDKSAWLYPDHQLWSIW